MAFFPRQHLVGLVGAGRGNARIFTVKKSDFVLPRHPDEENFWFLSSQLHSQRNKNDFFLTMVGILDIWVRISTFWGFRTGYGKEKFQLTPCQGVPMRKIFNKLLAGAFPRHKPALPADTWCLRLIKPDCSKVKRSFSIKGLIWRNSGHQIRAFVAEIYLPNLWMRRWESFWSLARGRN